MYKPIEFFLEKQLVKLLVEAVLPEVVISASMLTQHSMIPQALKTLPVTSPARD
jgi:hypothetical protein